MSYTQKKFDRALAQAEERARRTDFDQHIISTDMGDFVVIDEGDGALAQWQIDQTVYSVTGQLCLEDDRQLSWLPIEYIEQLEIPY